ncbi:MAG TPA: di-heme oxidoredictase family protein [Puia sp.]|nr:di-heme oxidoredictase family protein [Puia sp.]
MKKKATLITGSILLVIIAITSCSKLLPSMIDPSQGVCGPIDLSNAQAVLFAKGNDQFFAVRTAATGLGPYFVSVGCGNCHSSDNRGHPFTILTRFGQSDTTGNKFLNEGGPQLQNANLPGFMPQQIPDGATSSKLIAPITAGVGFLEAVPDSEILAMAAANVNDPDGVRGHPNYNSIPSYITPFANAIPRGDGKYICRFGRKGSTYNLIQQTATAYNHDMGITSTFMPYNPYNYLDQTLPSVSSTPEVSSDDFNSVVFYITCLQTPNQRNANDPTVQHGNQVFTQIGCATCHKQTLTTGYSPIDALSYQTFSPFTDLLVHDMGPGLDDGYTEGNAKTSEWRTAPLWGLGLAPQVQGGYTYLLHDGRAHSIEQAIQMHGGEAAASANRFTNLSASDKNALLTFLKSL